MEIYNNKNSLKSWQNKLLDISKRNRLINFDLLGPNKSKPLNLGILHPTFETFIKKILENKSKLYFNKPTTTKKNNKNKENEIFKPLKAEDLKIKTDYSDKNDIISNLPSEQQYIVFKNLIDKAKVYKNEKAINILYLAIGFLKWFDENDEKPYYSPVFLFPVQLSSIKKSANVEIFVLEFPDDAFLTLNLTLLKKLESLGITKILTNYQVDNTKKISEIYYDFKNHFHENFKETDWEIIDSIQLSAFDYSKIEIYTDLVENENKIIANEFYQTISDLSKSTKFDVAIDQKKYENNLDPENYFHILEADSTQETAIQAAIKGENFILDGPPGTGKSQTITNIINEFLARNKTVLFVSEKLAALNVVYGNLKKIGLEDSAIAVHNDKIDKKEIIKNLLLTLEKGTKQLEINKAEKHRIESNYIEIQRKLNNYFEKLMAIHPQHEKNLYQLIAKYENFRDSPDLDFYFPLEYVDNFDFAKLQKIELDLDDLFQKLKDIQFDFKNHVWFGLNQTKIDETKKQKLKSLITKINILTETITENLQKFDFILVHPDEYLKNIKKLFELLNNLFSLKNVNFVALQKIDNLSEEIKKYKNALQIFSEIQNLELIIKKDFTKNPLDLPLNDFYEIITNHQKMKVKFFDFKYKKIKKYLGLYSNKEDVVDVFLNHFQNFNSLKEKKSLFFELVSTLKFKLDLHTLDEINCNLNQLLFYQEFKLLEKTTKNRIHEAEFMNFFLDSNFTKNVLKEKLLDPLKDFFESWNKFEINFNLQDVNFYLMEKSKLLENLNLKLDNLNQTHSIVEINKSIMNLKSHGVYDFVKKIMDENIQNNFYKIFAKKFYNQFINKVISDEFENHNFQTLNLNRSKFAELQKDLDKLTKKKVEAILLQKIKPIDSLHEKNSEIRILKQEANKSRRLMPFRELFLRIPNLLKELKPCLMMSPILVSSFFKNNKIEFDLVIFDEASQLQPESAIGAIFRAKQYIIAGDKEQLPPTSFFEGIARNVDDEENFDEFDAKDYDSILDASQTFLKSYRLKWHYRSKFEELIQPSNSEIYNHDLITFPTSCRPKKFQGINFIKVSDGVYFDRKNEKEAEKVVEIVKEILDLYKDKYTIGVVTTNFEQQKLIEKHIEKFKTKNSKYAHLLSDEAYVDFFVKNIESVQGDERDFIIFSLNFGPNKSGKIIKNFGSINRKGGYRRLNVAFTRAKQGTIILSSIEPDDIDLSGGDSRGPSFLRKYLQFARFKSNFGQKNENLEIPKEDFRKSVENELEKLGYKFIKNYGFSNYKIDFAIINPNDENEFLLGIECDGSSYSLKNARDREILRQKVMSARGWKIFRICSIDWFYNREFQLEKLNELIENLLVKSDKIENDFEIISEEKEKYLEIPAFVFDKPTVNLKSFFQFRFEINDENLQNLYNQFNDEFQFIIEIFKKMKILHKNEFLKIISWLWGKNRVTQQIRGNATKISNLLVETGKIIEEKQHFLLRNVENYDFTIQPKRPFKEIHSYEMRDLITKIVEKTKSISEQSLYESILEITDFSHVKSDTKEYIMFCIDKLIVENVLFKDRFENLSINKK
ncbi:DUF4011 domain-containing protein [Mycoplasma sp. 'Moose RK']|uniref:DUF4011 domain-containing protein n=1 Tax=Mycoplasma sp. 'Moose RK' TaxID=2780095 RepID=UPI0018C1CF6D|nr:DUF4011 domain-containing protein [Mycoplasma sp. 'Moose RK']MBG0731035.1 DUF4011 domain-containing protein [Mycoplasma sp. 'Moose RK']